MGRYQAKRSVLPGARRSAAPTVVRVFGGRASIENLCEPESTSFALDRRGNTVVRAQWLRCEALPGGAELTATIDGATCATMSGAFSAPPGGVVRTFRAPLRHCNEFAEAPAAGEPLKADPPCDRVDLLSVEFQRNRSMIVARQFPAADIPRLAYTNAWLNTNVAPIALDDWVPMGPSTGARSLLCRPGEGHRRRPVLREPLARGRGHGRRLGDPQRRVHVVAPHRRHAHPGDLDPWPSRRATPRSPTQALATTRPAAMPRRSAAWASCPRPTAA